jgi:FMN reductase
VGEEVKVVSVLGSVTPPGRQHRAVNEALDRARAADPDIAVDRIDLAELTLGFADGTPLDQLEDDSAETVRRISEADAVLLASPVYRGSLTGALKNLLDLTPVDALRGKPVLIVAMGATDHHSLGVERHLRDILSFFGALPMPVDVYLTSADFENGVPREDAAGRLDQGITGLLTLARATGGLGEFGPDPLISRLSKGRS